VLDREADLHEHSLLQLQNTLRLAMARTHFAASNNNDLSQLEIKEQFLSAMMPASPKTRQG